MRFLLPLFLLFLAGLLLCPPRAAAQEIDTPTPTVALPARPKIDAPVGGEALQGQVPISGSSGVPGFFSAELSFAYTGDATGTWFLIQETFDPVQDGLLAVWDTFAITDGVYDLRLLVTLADGSQVETFVRGVRVRNYTPIETSTPTPSPTFTPAPTVDPALAFTSTDIPPATLTPTATPPPPTATPLPRNPAEVTARDIGDSLLRGAAGTLAVYLLLGIYTSLRRRGR